MGNHSLRSKNISESNHHELLLQSRGYCVAFCRKTMTIKAISENCTELFKENSDTLLKKALNEIFTEEVFLQIKAKTDVNVTYTSFEIPSKYFGQSLFVHLIKNNEYYILEIEKQSSKTWQISASEYQSIISQIDSLQYNSLSFQKLLNTLGEKIKADRTILLKFDDNGHSNALAEFTSEDNPKYFTGLKVPQKSFPWYLKEFLIANKIHYTKNCTVQPVKILSQARSDINLKELSLQSLSNYHLQYLNYLGFKSCIFLPISYDNKLWGSIVICFNVEYDISYNVKTHLETVSAFLGIKINLLEKEKSNYSQTTKRNILNALIEKISENENFISSLKNYEEKLLQIADATGAFILYKNETHLFGNTPNTDKLNILYSWIAEKTQKSVYYTESISDDFPPFLSIKKDFCGLLALSLSSNEPCYIVWFKPEFNQLVKWSSNPEYEQNLNKETPKFIYNDSSVWKMMVSGKSKPWQRDVVDCTIELCNVLSKSIKRRNSTSNKQKEKSSLYTENSSDLFTIINADFSVQYVSESVKKLLGYTAEEFKAKWPTIVHKKHRIAFQQYFEQYLKDKDANNKFQYLLQKANGKYYFFESIFTNHLTNTQIKGVIANSRNIDLRVNTEKRIKKLEKLLEVSTNGVLIMNATLPELSVVYANPAFEEITGYSLNEVVGHPFPFLEYDGINNQAIHLLKKAFENIKPCEVLLQCKKKDGSDYWNYLQIAPVTDNYKREVSFIAAITDVTYRRETEEKLEAYMSKLRNSNEELQTFAYVASHDLQEPLRTITGFTELIAETHKGKLDEETDEYIDFILSATHRMRKLIQDLLLFSRVSTAKEYITEIDLNETISTALKNLQSAIEDTQAIISYDTLPKVFANQTMILQVFQNIISNAIKYRNPDTFPRIHIGLEDYNQSWMFYIEDNGIGIDSQYFERIFIIFQRLHTKEEYSGTGIGLAICKKIVERYGGKIWLESKKDIGSKFYFTIPKELNLQ